MGVNGLEKTKDDPAVDSHNVKIATESAVEDGTSKGTGSEDEDFSGMSVLSSETEWRRVLVVNLVDVLVQGTPVKRTVSCNFMLASGSSKSEVAIITYQRSGTYPQRRRRKQPGER